MEDLSKTIEPKSDQLNSDDLLAGPMTITVTKVTASPSSEDQPVSIFFQGDHGKPFKPAKSMRRLLVATWGKDGSTYVGKSMTLFREPTVKFGGLEVGGIRISHLSHIDKPMTLALTATRGSRKPYTVKPLVVDLSEPVDAATLQEGARQAAENGKDALQGYWKKLTKDERAAVQVVMEELKAIALKADTVPELEPADDYDNGNITDDEQTEIF